MILSNPILKLVRIDQVVDAPTADKCKYESKPELVSKGTQTEKAEKIDKSTQV